MSLRPLHSLIRVQNKLFLPFFFSFKANKFKKILRKSEYTYMKNCARLYSLALIFCDGSSGRVFETWSAHKIIMLSPYSVALALIVLEIFYYKRIYGQWLKLRCNVDKEYKYILYEVKNASLPLGNNTNLP